MIGVWDEYELKKEVLSFMKVHYKIPGKISAEEIEGLCNVLQLIDEICSKISGSKISWAYYEGISWSRKKYSEIEGRNYPYNSSEGYQYYRSPYFVIEYSSEKGFIVKREEGTKKLRKSESDIEDFVKENNYVYYAINVSLSDEIDFKKFKSELEDKLFCQILQKVNEPKKVSIIPLSNIKLTSELSSLAKQMNLISNTLKNGFFLGGQREITHLQIEEDSYGDIEYKY